jgi:cytochrome c2
VGPNLSGLFTPFYPKTARNGQRWTPELLEEWIKNPRAVRPGTTMLPVRLSAGDLARAVQQLEGDPLQTGADATPDRR